MRGIILIFIATFSFSTFCLAQNEVKIDERLHELYAPSQLEHFQDSNPQLLERLNFYLDHAFIITTLNEDKPSKILGEVIIEDLTNFNILQIEKNQTLKRSWDKISAYQIEGTDQLLIYHAGRNFNRDFQKHYRKIRK